MNIRHTMIIWWAAFEYTTYNDHTVGWGAFEIFTFQNSKNVQKIRRCGGLVVRVPASRLPVPGLSLDPWPTPSGNYADSFGKL